MPSPLSGWFNKKRKPAFSQAELHRMRKAGRDTAFEPTPSEQTPLSQTPLTNHALSDAGEGTQQLQALLDQTLVDYPRHFEVAMQAVRGVPDGDIAWRCVGGMETGLTEHGMEVTFDFRHTASGWRRVLVSVTMTKGRVVGVTCRELKRGESSGLEKFEEDDRGA